MKDLYYDPYDFDIDADPHPVWGRMRDEAPLYRNDEYEFWALSRYEVLARWPDWQIDFDAAEMARTSTVRGWKTLPAQV